MNSRPVQFKVFNIIAAVIFFALAAWEAYNDLKGIPRAGYTTGANIVGVVLVPLWLVCSVSLLMPRRWSWRPEILFAGVLACVMHGAVLRVGRATVAGYSGGAAIIGAAVLLTLLFAPSMRAWLAARRLVSPGKLGNAKEVRRAA